MITVSAQQFALIHKQLTSYVGTCRSKCYNNEKEIY